MPALLFPKWRIAADTIADQLNWMRAAGFGEVDVFFRHAERAVFGGLKAVSTPPLALPPVEPGRAIPRGI